MEAVSGFGSGSPLMSGKCLLLGPKLFLHYKIGGQNMAKWAAIGLSNKCLVGFIPSNASRTSSLSIKNFYARHTLEFRGQRTVETVRTVNQLIAIRISGLARDDLNWRDCVVKPKAAQNSQDTLAG